MEGLRNGLECCILHYTCLLPKFLKSQMPRAFLGHLSRGTLQTGDLGPWSITISCYLSWTPSFRARSCPPLPLEASRSLPTSDQRHDLAPGSIRGVQGCGAHAHIGASLVALCRLCHDLGCGYSDSEGTAIRWAGREAWIPRELHLVEIDPGTVRHPGPLNGLRYIENQVHGSLGYPYRCRWTELFTMVIVYSPERYDQP